MQKLIKILKVNLLNILTEKENLNVSSKIETKKPLEQVNISDLLALHKKS